jgi:hypothetical protein
LSVINAYISSYVQQSTSRVEEAEVDESVDTDSKEILIQKRAQLSSPSS